MSLSLFKIINSLPHCTFYRRSLLLFELFSTLDAIEDYVNTGRAIRQIDLLLGHCVSYYAIVFIPTLPRS